jgi:hypothetical protein
MWEQMDPKLFVDSNDLSSLRYYKLAAKEILGRAETEESESEKKRLISVAKGHLAKIDWILNKYAESSS